MNTRLQVEHPVTEEITGLDLVEWQLRVASGERLPLGQDRIRMIGHAIEVRLCAEDPASGFLPSVGRIQCFEQVMGGSGERLETGVAVNDEVSPYYDSMIAKVIMKRSTRGEAIDALIRSTERLLVGGLTTNARFLINLLDCAEVRRAAMDTGLIGRELAQLTRPAASRAAIQKALESRVRNGAAMNAETPHARASAPGPWSVSDAFALGPTSPRTYKVLIDGKPSSFQVAWAADGRAGWSRYEPRVTCEAWPDSIADDQSGDIFIRDSGDAVFAFERGHQTILTSPAWDATALDDGQAGDHVRAPINGKVARVFVREGDAVAKGDRVAIVEAMKMEHVLHAARDGKIIKVSAGEGSQVNQGTVIASLG
jgi:3-methylcrotonyl-CoA carboxylase alpha subunit